MFGGGTCSFSFGTKVRTLEPVRAEKNRAQFFVGTSTLNQSNQIYFVQLDDHVSSLSTQSVFNHPGEVLSLAPSPHDRQLLVTCGKQRGHLANASLWKLPGIETRLTHVEKEEHAATTQDLEELATFPAQQRPVTEIAWDATNAVSTLVSSHETLLRTWRVDQGAVEAQEELKLDVSMLHPTTQKGASAMVWDPHHAEQVAFALGRTVRTWDLRAQHDSQSIQDAHPSATLSLDFNPNKPHALASGGDDGRLKFWDLRYAQQPLLAMNAHSHWVWTTQYHPQHDQLVLSGSSDATLALWRVSSISSSPLVELDERDLMNEAADGAAVADMLIRRVDEHQDAVYAARWAAGGDAWTFVSVSYDGRLAVNHVPSTEKYKILL